jgi:predicted nucleic acid-binding protein
VYLLDTNVISELRKTKPHGAVSAWFASIRRDAVKIPACVIGEIQAGIELARNQNPAKASEIKSWLERLISFYEVIPMDAPIFRSWARLMHTRSDDLAIDAMIAATAFTENLTVVTRDIKHFRNFGVPLLNPFIHLRPNL